MFDKKWIKPMALAMSLPSSALMVAWFLWTLVDQQVISKNVAVIVFLLIIGNILVSMVIYALRNSKKNNK
jgi:multisubunit Na+/H+ antiporter MnhG subunit